MITSPPLSPSPWKERGRSFKRGLAPPLAIALSCSDREGINGA
jgi:hypothetical protein